jgi:hypothetical protein
MGVTLVEVMIRQKYVQGHCLLCNQVHNVTDI